MRDLDKNEKIIIKELITVVEWETCESHEKSW